MSKKYWFAILGGAIGLIPSIFSIVLFRGFGPFDNPIYFLIIRINQIIDIPGSIIGSFVMFFIFLCARFFKFSFEQLGDQFGFFFTQALLGTTNVASWAYFLYWVAARRQKKHLSDQI